MRCLAVICVCAAAAFAAEIPAGTNLEVRLTTPVSALTAHPKDRVEAVVIAPVAENGLTLLAAGATVSGSVLAATQASDVQNATVTLEWTKLHIASKTIPVATRLYSIDNVRETVAEGGAILGISPKDTITGRIDQGLGKLGNSRIAGLAQMLEMAKNVLLKNADPNISLEAGTEMTLRFVKSVAVPETPHTPTPPVPDLGHLAELVNAQMWQTYAASPPRPSDVTNLMFIGDLDRITEAFREAGWVGAQNLSGESKWETARAIIEQRGYKEAPVSVILLNRLAPDLVLQKANNTFSARHHLRIWRSPDTYQGQQVWLCAATHDIGIDYSDRDRTFIHKIDSNIDVERRKVLNDLLFTGKVRGVATIDRPAVPTNFQNGTGDDVNTDARMAVLLL